MANVTRKKDLIWELSEGIAKLAAVVVGIALAYNTLSDFDVWFITILNT